MPTGRVVVSGDGRVQVRGTGRVCVDDPLKGTESNPGVSAVDIQNSGQTTSGWQYIKTSGMAQARQVQCNMDDEGGGWMLIGQTPRYATGSGGYQGLRQPNIWEGGEGTFDRLCTNTMELWQHGGSSQCTTVMKMATATSDAVPLLTNCSIANKVVQDNPSNLLLNTTLTGAHTTGNFTSFANNTKFTGTWSPVKGHTAMSGSLTVDAPGDWIQTTSGVWWTVCGPSTELTANGRSGNAQGTGSWTNQGSNIVYGIADVAASANSGVTNLNTQAVQIK